MMPPDLSVPEMTAWVWLDQHGITPTVELARELADRLDEARKDGARMTGWFIGFRAGATAQREADRRRDGTSGYWNLVEAPR